MRRYFLSCRIHFCQRVYNGFPHIVSRTPHRSGHDTRLTTEIDDLHDVSTRTLDRLNVETGSVTGGKSTTDVDWEFAVVTVDGCTNGNFTERT